MLLRLFLLRHGRTEVQQSMILDAVLNTGDERLGDLRQIDCMFE